MLYVEYLGVAIVTRVVLPHFNLKKEESYSACLNFTIVFLATMADPQLPSPPCFGGPLPHCKVLQSIYESLPS